MEDDAEVVIKIFVIFTAPSGELSFTRFGVRGCCEDWGVGKKTYIQWKLVSSIVPLLEFLVSSSGARGPWTSVYLLVQNSLSSSNGVARTSGYIELETPPLDRNNSNLLELILIIRRFISKVQIYLDLL